MVARISRPSLPRLAPLPGGVRGFEPPAFSDLPAGKAIVDEFGLDAGIYGNYPTEQRRLVVKMLAATGGSKRAKPPIGATIAEAVMFGLLLDHGMKWTNSPTVGTGQFRFQSYELGGRQPGGAVTDFYLNHSGTRVAVRVQSVFHDRRNPFGGGAQARATDLRLLAQLMASVYIDTVQDVNVPPERVLETSPSVERVHREYFRAIGKAV